MTWEFIRLFICTLISTIQLEQCSISSDFPDLRVIEIENTKTWRSTAAAL